MKKGPQTIEELAKQRLSKELNESVDGVWLYVTLNSKGGELHTRFSWGKTTALVFGLMGFWKSRV